MRALSLIPLLASLTITLTAAVSAASPRADICRLAMSGTATGRFLPTTTVRVALAPQVKPENFLLAEALKRHFSAERYTPEMSRSAIRRFVEIMDPFEMFLTQAEVKELFEASPALVQKIHHQVFSSDSRDIHGEIVRKVMNRLEATAQKFSRSLSNRERVLARARELKALPEKEATKELPRPVALEEIEKLFLDMLAWRVNGLLDRSVQLKRPMTERQAFSVMVREVRFMLQKFAIEHSVDLLPLMIAKSYIETLDPHSTLMLPLEFKNMRRAMEGQLAGIGVTMSAVEKGAEIISVMEGSPAEKAGLKKGDVIFQIEFDNGRQRQWLEIDEFALEEVSDVIKGPIGSDLKMNVVRDGKFMRFSVTRGLIQLNEKFIETKIVDGPNGKVAHIRLRQFYEDAGAHLREEIKKLKEEHRIEAIVLDLRQNGGGSVREMARILGVFVHSGPAMVFKYRDRVEVIEIDNGAKTEWDGPLLVQVDGGSASASEALPGALQDYKRAIVVGNDHSFGKGSMQKIEPAGDRRMPFGVKITQALFFWPSGRTPQWQGVSSDIVLPSYVEKMSSERDYEHSIRPTTIPGYLDGRQPMISQLPSIIAELAKRSAERVKGREKAETSQKVYELNTTEADLIAQDLIELSKPR